MCANAHMDTCAHSNQTRKRQNSKLTSNPISKTKVSSISTLQMSAPIEYKIDTPHGELKVQVETEEDKFIILLPHLELANLLERSNKPNLRSLRIEIFAEVTSPSNETTTTLLPIPEEIMDLTASQLRNLNEEQLRTQQ